MELGDNGYIVANDTMPVEDIALAFRIAANEGRRGIVVKMDQYSGADNQRVVEQLRIMEDA